MKTGPVHRGVSLLSDSDVHLFREGRHFRLYEKLGSHPMEVDGVGGTLFATWAPSAKGVSVVGDFNGWDPDSHSLEARWDGSGIWEGFLPGVGKGSLYKYHIISHHQSDPVTRGDPFAFHWEIPPETASIVWPLDYRWRDRRWMDGRDRSNRLDAPCSIYEVHLGSWRRQEGDGHRSLNYREMGRELTEYVQDVGFTHVEFLPVTEHPFFGSWGYQSTGYFAPTSRFGRPQDFMNLIDRLHQAGIGVILDWVPSHFATDAHGLGNFDGTHLFEHADPQKGFHPDWNSYIFNYGRNEVRAFLISSALFWLDRYHLDGLRVDAVASLLYLDYSRPEGEWIPNPDGGRENLEAIDFIRQLNQVVYENYPSVQTIAEESTDWPQVSAPVDSGGLGFGMKWKMGWMHDTLEYFSQDPLFRKQHHDKITFSIWYAFNENFVLPLSHDEVVHGKRSLLGKMPGDAEQKFANLRLLYGFMYSHPGKKLLFMGAEIGQWKEWDHDSSLDWELLRFPSHAALKSWVTSLNRVYRSERALHERDFDEDGYEWVDLHDRDASVISYLRHSADRKESVLIICNFTPVARQGYRVGAPHPGRWREILNSDDEEYGGRGGVNADTLQTEAVPMNDRQDSLIVNLPGLGIVFLKPER